MNNGRYWVYYALISLMLCIYLFSVHVVPNDQAMMSHIVFVSTFMFICYILFVKCIFHRFLTFTTLFFCLLWLFNFGQPVLIAFEQTNELRIVLDYFTPEDNFYSFKYITLAYVAMMLGALCSECKYTRLQQSTVTYNDEDLKKIEKTAKLILLCTFPIKAAIDIPTLLIGLISDYSIANQWQNSIPDIFVTYGCISIIGMGLLIVSQKNNRRLQTKYLVCFLLYLVSIMMAGRRSETVSYIVILCFLYVKSAYKTISTIKVLLCCILGYMFLGLLSVIVVVRTYLDSRDISTIFDAYISVLTEYNVLFDALRAYGNTGYTAQCVILKWLDTYGPTYGMSYIGGLSAVFPNIGNLFGPITHETGFHFLLQDKHMLDSHYENIGGSMIGEIFFNFGLIGGPIFAFLAGMIIGKISKDVEKCFNGKDITKIVYYIALMSALVYWIRDYWGGLSREIVWSLIICRIIYKKVFNKTIVN